MTALRWFLSYLLPILIVSSIAAAYFYRDRISSDWYQTLSWPVTQINAVLKQQSLQLGIVKPAISTELVLNKTAPDTNAMTSDAQAISNIKSRKEAANNKKPLMHPIESYANSTPDADGKTPLMHRVKPVTPKMPTLPKSSDTVAPESLPQKIKPAEKLALAPTPMLPQTQQRYMPFPQHRMIPPVMRPSPPGYHTPKPPTQFKLNKKQLKLLYLARKSFWTNDFKKAKKQYLSLTKQLSDNPDIHGELGNLFYRERKLESAIKHYTIAAKLLIKHRHYWKLPQIMQIVSRFNPAKAREVMTLMHSRNALTRNKSDNSKKGK